MRPKSWVSNRQRCNRVHCLKVAERRLTTALFLPVQLHHFMGSGRMRKVSGDPNVGVSHRKTCRRRSGQQELKKTDTRKKRQREQRQRRQLEGARSHSNCDRVKTQCKTFSNAGQTRGSVEKFPNKDLPDWRQ